MIRRFAPAAWPIMAALAGPLSCSTDAGEHRSHGPHDGRDHRPTHDNQATTVVRVSGAAVARTEMRIEAALRTSLAGGVRVPAEVALEPDHVVHVAALVEGQLAEVHASVGDTVEQGAALAALHSVPLGETRAALSEAQAELAVAQANYDRQRELSAEGIGAKRNLIEAEGALRRARARVQGLRNRSDVYGRGGSGATTLLRAPIRGEVVQRHATVGEVVAPDQTLFTIADTSVVWITGSVYPQDVAAVRAGAQVTFLSEDLPGKRWQGTLDWVSPMLDQATRTLPIRLVLDNADHTLRPGLFGTLLVSRGDQKATVTVADTGVEEIAGNEVVFVPAGKAGDFAVRPVVTGTHEDGRVEIRQGLKEGERYVAQGTFVLKSELLRHQLGEGHAH